MKLFCFSVAASIGGAMGAVCGFRFDDRKPKTAELRKERRKTNMKMENTSMEFVAFDAQDVITTSGGPTAISFTVTDSLFDIESGWDFAGDYAIWWKGDENSCVIYANRTPMESGTYTISKGAEYYYIVNDKENDCHDYALEIYDGLTSGETGTPCTTFSGIVDWIKANGKYVERKWQ